MSDRQRVVLFDDKMRRRSRGSRIGSGHLHARRRISEPTMSKVEGGDDGVAGARVGVMIQVVR
jgi:hypothetical protein